MEFHQQGSKDEMAQNLVSNHLGSEEWAQLDGALDSAETTLARMLIALDAKERQRKVKMGDGSVAFCRAAIDVFNNNLHLMPRSFDLGEMRRDFASHDALNERIVRLTRMIEKMRQTEMALGSDVMSAALEGYKVLQATGKGQGIEAL